MNDQKLVDRVKKGDQKAMKYLYNKFAPGMKAICLRYVKYDEEAEDILQEAFIKIFNNIGQYKNPHNLSGWIKTIVINTAINNYYKNKKLMMNVSYDEINGNEAYAVEIAEKVSLDQLYQVINELPEGYRLVFNLYAIDGYDHKEIGEILEISESTSRSQYSRARKILIQRLNEVRL